MFFNLFNNLSVRSACIFTIKSQLFFFFFQALGQLGHVIHIQPSSEVRVLVKGQRWLFKPECLRSAPGETIPEYTAGMCMSTFQVPVLKPLIMVTPIDDKVYNINRCTLCTPTRDNYCQRVHVLANIVAFKNCTICL